MYKLYLAPETSRGQACKRDIMRGIAASPHCEQLRDTEFVVPLGGEWSNDPGWIGTESQWIVSALNVYEPHTDFTEKAQTRCDTTCQNSGPGCISLLSLEHGPVLESSAGVRRKELRSEVNWRKWENVVLSCLWCSLSWMKQGSRRWHAQQLTIKRQWRQRFETNVTTCQNMCHHHVAGIELLSNCSQHYAMGLELFCFSVFFRLSISCVLLCPLSLQFAFSLQFAAFWTWKLLFPRHLRHFWLQTFLHS